MLPETPAVTLSRAVVRYGETVAVAGVSLAIARSHVHALIGENGAGKSTLLRAIAGVTPLDQGTLACPPGLAIEWVPQELILAPDLTVAETIFLGRERRGRGRLLRRAEMRHAAEVALARIGCGALATARVGDLSLPVRKQVQLARAFCAPADVLLLDEPTAVLGAEASEKLFVAIRQARNRGAAVVYVSHQIEEVLRIADTVTVLRDGQRVSTDPTGAVDAATLVTRMVGRPVPSLGRRAAGAGPVLLRLRDLHAPGVRGATFDVAAGEVVGLAGLVGAGRSELLATIAGLLPRSAGEMEVRGPLAFVPEDRARNGLIPTLSLRENIFLPAPQRWPQKWRERAECERWIGRLHIRARGPEALPDSLSGGNQQKVLLARALRRTPKVLLLDEPTAGVDIGAKADIHRIVHEHTGAGAAVVIASSELPELLALCDRIVALRHGRQVAIVGRDQATESHLAALITGAERSPAAAAERSGP